MTESFVSARRALIFALMLPMGQSPGESVLGNVHTSSPDVTVTGSAASAIAVALAEFPRDQSGFQIENFMITVVDQGAAFEVRFVPKRVDADRNLRGGQGTLGRVIYYSISKKDYKILGKSGFR